MDSILRFPTRAYDHVYATYGFMGILFMGLLVAVGIVGVCIWFDRRR